jgi:hypothetical protein
MRRILGFVIVLSLLFLTPAFAWQNNYDYTTRLNFSTYISDNTTGTYKVTYADKTTIVPGTAHILGYSIMKLNGENSEILAALHDSEITDVYLDESLLDESEADTSTGVGGRWFPYPKSIKTQLCIRQGANTRVIVYYSTI